ncbi:hypothetical protein UK12_26055 [Saccharothrix sp. ST-888]|nr:hypothetical protein UK12_26055 [Saccharothrix sp. ST-888]
MPNLRRSLAGAALPVAALAATLAATCGTASAHAVHDGSRPDRHCRPMLRGAATTADVTRIAIHGGRSCCADGGPRLHGGTG